MNDRLTEELDKEIAATRSRLAALEQARAALAGTGSNGTAPNVGRNPGRDRAPAGALEEAMMKALKAHPGQSNGEIRAALKKDGYAFSLSPLHVGKRLSQLVDKKDLVVKLDGGKRKYYLK